MRSHLRRIAGFALVPALSLIASLVLLPLISSRFGSAGWVALNLGQSIGAIISVVVGMAWPVIGGNAVARAEDRPARQEIYRQSISSRLIVLIILLLLGTPVTALLSRAYPLATVLFMIGIALNGLTASWFYSGTGRPRHLVINEGLVRLLGYAVALLGLLAGAGLLWYAGTTVVAGLIMSGLNWITIMGRQRPRSAGQLRVGLSIVREQLGGTGSRLLTSAFGFGGPIVFSLTAPAALPMFSVFDQLQKASSNALSVLPNAFVAWVGSASPADRRGRVNRSVGFLCVIAAAVVPGWLLVGPILVRWLFAGRIELGFVGDLLLALSIALFQLCLTVQLLVLVPLGQQDRIYLGNSVAAVAGLVMIIIGALAAGALGGVTAWILADLGLLGFYAWVLRGHPGRAEQTS